MPVAAAAKERLSDDKVSISVDVLELKTSKGNTLIVGTASAYREGPPRSLLAAGKFQSSLSTTRELAEPAPKRWGAMALARLEKCSTISGCVASAAMAACDST